MEQEIVVNEKTYKLIELKYKDVAALGAKEGDQGESAKRLMMISTGMTKEEYNELSMKDGLEVQKAINKFNGFEEDFQQPPTE